jgi:hypothetical protein
LVDCSKLNGLWKVAKNAGWWMPFDSICFISERPILLNRDEQGRLHCSNGPAMEYPDGWKIYSYHGVLINNPEIIENPGSITVNMIEKETNAEIKRIMLEQYGWNKYLIDSKAEEISKDKFGILYKKIIPGDEDLVMVRVVNSTKEGLWTKQENKYKFFPAYNEKGEEYRKNYFLRVPPSTKTAHEAVAWTYDMTPEEYNPIMET